VIHSGQHGLLVPVQDPQALAAAITEMVEDPVRCRALGEAAFQRVRDTFSFEAMTRQYETLYYRLI
jgi:glycosyltransferase involved in cell wall biosynthesis